MQGKIISLLFIISIYGCVPSPKLYRFGYEPGMSIVHPIKAKTKLSITVESFAEPSDFPNLRKEIEESIIRDLHQTVFPVLVETNPDLYVNICVKLLSYEHYEMGNKLKSVAKIALSILSRNGEIISEHEAEKEVSKQGGYLTEWEYTAWGENSVMKLSLQQTMDDIKSRIEKDRDEIIGALRDAKPPEIVILSPARKRGIAVVSGDYKQTVIGKALDPSGIVWVKINEKEVQTNPISGGVSFNEEIFLTAGNNYITVEAMDIHRNKSRQVFTIRNEERVASVSTSSRYKPNLWVLTIGVSDYKNQNLSLKYADSDATSISKVFKSQEGRLFSKVHYRTLLNQKATRDNIIKYMGDFLGQAAYDDVVIIFVAGHGVKHKQTGSYYFLTYDAEPDNLLSRGLRWTDFDEAVNILQTNVSKVLLLFDTCHAGAMKVAMRGAEAGEDLAETLKKSEGIFILSASKAGEQSEESSRFKLAGETMGHGVFTYALLKALSGLGDFDRDGSITITELFRYVAKNVPVLTQGSQHPYFKVSGTDMPIWKK